MLYWIFLSTRRKLCVIRALDHMSWPAFLLRSTFVVINTLGIMLLAAFIAMLIKIWVQQFDRSFRAMSIPEQ